ncbi:MAG: trypsin-like peptidase domain-containing protein [Akkermansiaceae bacterium]|nr:trypsin-like peptidase domain-containing protein [Verrucomicrobiales bacterium]
MRWKQNSTVALCTLILSLSTAVSRADEFAEKGREIFKKNQYAVVTVQVVIKASGGGGRSSENKQEITGTVVDPSGLTVLALSACDPAEMYRKLSDDYKMEVEVSDIKMLLEDGTELASEIVLRDKDLDLAFIRPKTKPASPMVSVDLSKSGSAQVLDVVVTLNRLNKAASRAYAASSERIAAVIQKPRTFYIPDSGMSSTTMGSPAFLPDGKVLGIFVMRAVSAAGGSGGNFRQNLTSIILPAEDVLKGAKQAPEAKGEDEKKEEPKPAAEKPAVKAGE